MEHREKLEKFQVYTRILADNWDGPVIGSRWVDEIVKSRIVGREFKKDSGGIEDAALFAGTPDHSTSNT